MAFKLKKAESKLRDEHVAALEVASRDLSAAIATYNEAVANAWEEIAPLLEAYNEALGEARDFVEDVASRIEGEIGNKSENWADSDKNQAAAEWRDAWQNVELDDIEIEQPDTLEEPDLTHRDDIENLPDAAE